MAPPPTSGYGPGRTRPTPRRPRRIRNARLEQLEQQQYAAPPPQQYAPPPPAPAAPPAAAPAAGGTDVVTQLTELAKLKDAGVLTQEEFDAAKAKLLA